MRISDVSSAVYSPDLLDGGEPAEPLIGTRDTALLRELETAMASVRAAIGNGADAAEVQARAEAAVALLDRAEATISDNASAGEIGRATCRERVSQYV